jgi:hypothetical protein
MTYKTMTQSAAAAAQQPEVRAEVGITELNVADLRHVSGGGFILSESIGIKPAGFILSESVGIKPAGFILSE